MSPKNKNKNLFINATKASLDNAERLLSDAKWLNMEESAATVYALSILAQEEFSKGFILHLVSLGCIPWNSETRKMLRNHSCKQLFTLILDFLEPEFETFLLRRKELQDDLAKGIKRPVFPSNITDAINIIRHEKATKYGYRNDWVDDNEPCDKLAKKISDGYIDELKQDALYVDIGKTGEVVNNPLRITQEIAMAELDKADRFSRGLSYRDGKMVGLTALDFEKLSAAFKVVFGIIPPEEYAKNWWI